MIKINLYVQCNSMVISLNNVKSNLLIIHII